MVVPELKVVKILTKAYKNWGKIKIVKNWGEIKIVEN